jgi:hypothetical protein
MYEYFKMDVVERKTKILAIPCVYNGIWLEVLRETLTAVQ